MLSDARLDFRVFLYGSRLRYAVKLHMLSFETHLIAVQCHSLFIFLIENYCLFSACCWRLFSCWCFCLTSSAESSLLYGEGLLLAVSCALKTNIPIFIQAQVVFALKPNGGVRCISVPSFGFIGLACESCSET